MPKNDFASPPDPPPTSPSLFCIKNKILEIKCDKLKGSIARKSDFSQKKPTKKPQQKTRHFV